MNKQEILQTLNMSSVPDFPTLHSLCRDPESLESVLSLAIARGELKGRMDTVCDYNRIFRGACGATEPVPRESVTADLSGENLSEFSDLTSDVVDVGLDNVVGFVLL